MLLWPIQQQSDAAADALLAPAASFTLALDQRPAQPFLATLAWEQSQRARLEAALALATDGRRGGVDLVTRQPQTVSSWPHAAAGYNSSSSQGIDLEAALATGFGVVGMLEAGDGWSPATLPATAQSPATAAIATSAAASDISSAISGQHVEASLV
jgi:hypothetical protein